MQHILLSLCLAASLGLGTAEARIPSDMGDPPIIIVIQDGDQPEIGNRGPVVPIDMAPLHSY